MNVMRPCLICGQLDEDSRCREHRREGRPGRPAHLRGYDHRWRLLSQLARKLQPFCEDCGATDDLQADHSVASWERKAAGKTIRLKDISVVCGRCNRARGAARGDSVTRTV